MAELSRISPDWEGEPCIVAAPGPSLTADVVRRCRMARWLNRWRIVAVQDAYKVMPFADAMYGCDVNWWHVHRDCAGFAGEKWSTHAIGPDNDNDKRAAADAFDIRLVRGENGDTFSSDPAVIRYGSNSGFQTINLAILKGCRRIVLVGFDMRRVGGRSHFFGVRPKGQDLGTEYERFACRFARAAKALPPDVRIVNATPASALTCFPMVDLEAALAADFRGADGRVHRDGAVPDMSPDGGCAA